MTAAATQTSEEDPRERDCVTEFRTGISGRPAGLSRAPDGKVWFTEPATDKLGTLDPETGRITEFPLPRDSAPRHATFSPDGQMWFTSSHDRIGSFDTTRRIGLFTKGITKGSTPHTPAVAGDGKLYFTYENAPKLGRLDLNTKEITEVGDGLKGEGGLHGLAVDDRGNLWAARPDAGQLVRFSIRAQRFDRTIRLARDARPHDVAVGANARLYTTLQGAAAIGEFDPRTGKRREFRTDLRAASTPDHEPDFKLMELATDGSRGAVWGTSFQANKLYKLDLHDRKLTQPICNLPSGGSSTDIVVADGTVWYADPLAGRIVRVDHESGS